MDISDSDSTPQPELLAIPGYHTLADAFRASAESSDKYKGGDAQSHFGYKEHCFRYATQIEESGAGNANACPWRAGESRNGERNPVATEIDPIVCDSFSYDSIVSTSPEIATRPHGPPDKCHSPRTVKTHGGEKSNLDRSGVLKQTISPITEQDPRPIERMLKRRIETPQITSNNISLYQVNATPPEGIPNAGGMGETKRKTSDILTVQLGPLARSPKCMMADTPSIGDTEILRDLREAAKEGVQFTRAIYSDVVEDSDSIRSVVRARRDTIAANFSKWPTGVVLISLGVLLMSRARDIHMQDLVHFLFLAQGEEFLRAHDGQTYIYMDGAFTVFSGLIPESLLTRCNAYAQRVEGALWCIGRRGVKSRDDLSILEALNEAFGAINKTNLCEIDGSDKGGGKGKGRGRGQLNFRSWLERGPETVDGALLSGQDDAISEKKVVDALSNLASDMWKARVECPNWLELAAANTLHLSSTLQTKLVSKELIPYYAEYMETASSPQSGIATLDACVLFDTGDSTGASGDPGLRQIPKHHSSNIYVYISHCLKQNFDDPAHQSCTR